tara:strand:+ start:1369 stop:2511 length:1143 start_codon:yes stop_codon:yes gene_type:complete
MNFDQLAQCAFTMWRQALEAGHELPTICVLGPPGVGKTSAGKHLANLMTDYVQRRNPGAGPAVLAPGGSLDLSSMLPEDLMGLPQVDAKANVTRYRPQSWLKPFCEEGAYGVLILDDLPAASAQVQVACRQVSLDRRIHDNAVSPGVLIMVTGNRREDKSAASTLPAHFRNSVVMLPFSPDREGWEKWYADQGYDSDIPAFLHFRPAHFSRLPKDADALGAFATPRTWSLLGRVSKGVSEDALAEVSAGLVGQGVATEFMAFRLLRKELVDPARVLEAPREALPDLGVLNSPDRMIAMMTGLSEIAAQKAKGKGRNEVFFKYLKALAYVSQDSREFLSAALSTFTSNKGDLNALLRVARQSRGDEDIRTMLQALAAVFRS